MFFGNQVTFEYWNNVWLNEGFASYLEYVIADKVIAENNPPKLIASLSYQLIHKTLDFPRLAYFGLFPRQSNAHSHVARCEAKNASNDATDQHAGRNQ